MDQLINIDLNDFNDLIDMPHEEITGLAIKRELQWIFTLLENKNVKLSPRIFERLISTMIAEFDKNFDASSTEHRQLVSNILECIQIQVTKFPSAEGKSLLEQLWSLSLNGEHVHPLAAQILVKLFDDFIRDLGLERCPDLLVVIQQLLQSKEKKERQSAYFLMRKLKEIFDTNNDVAGAIKYTKQQWSDYIDVMEQLEEEQLNSNLARFLDDFKSDDDFFPWIYNLYKRSLQSDNISIVYETVKFIMGHLKLSQLTELNLLEDFLAATNRTQLYNVDDDERSYPLFQNFVSKSEIESIIEALVNVSWEWNSVPLCEWLKSIPKEEEGELPSINKETLFKLCSRVIRLKNRKLCQDAEYQVECLFQATIGQLTLGDYLTFIEMMYKNRFGHFNNYESLTSKIVGCDSFKKQIAYFNPICLEILFNFDERRTISKVFNGLCVSIIKELRKLPKDQHGWLRLLITYEIMIGDSDEIRDFYSTEYGVDVSLVQSGKDLKAIQEHLLDKLKCETSEEKSYVLKVITETFVNRIKNWSEIKELQLNPVDLLQQGGWKTQRHLANLLEKCNQRLQDENVLPAFVASLKKHPCFYTAENIGQYASKHLTIEEQNSLSVEIIGDHLHINGDVIDGIFMSDIKKPVPEQLQKLLYNLPLSDNAWVESSYNYFYGVDYIFRWFIQHAIRQSDAFVDEIVYELIRLNEKLSKIHPHIQRNSKEYRLNFYIAESLLILAEKYQCSNQLWSLLLSQNDQLNITCMYELIVARTLPSLEPLLNRLESISTVDSNQQVSLLSVTNIYLHLNGSKLDSEQQQKVFAILLSLTMKDDSQVRQFAKWILNELINMCKDNSFSVPLCNSLGATFECDLASISLGPQIQARLLLHKILPIFPQFSAQFHVFCCYTFLMSNLQPIYFPKKKLTKMNLIRNAIKLALTELQLAERHERNILSISDIYPKPNLTSQITLTNDADLIVVAVFIDDLKRLNVLIQTCKAFGVRTLILNESTNLSANCADLNIVKLKSKSIYDYLREKKLENYNVVATKNSAESDNIAKFSFARKTILVYGHEKHGIPENLIHFLDKTVELKQTEFEHLQNLLIFMYYKQYFIKE